MRFWVRLTGVVIPLTLIPLIFVGVTATQISFEGSRGAIKESAGRTADSQAAFVELWLSDQVSALDGWMRPFDVRGDERLTAGLSRAVFLAVPTVQTAVLVDKDGVSISETFLTTPDAQLGRQIGSARRAQQLIDRLPLSQVVSVTEIRTPDQARELRPQLLAQGVDPRLLERYVSGAVSSTDLTDETGALRPEWQFLRVVVPAARTVQVGEAYLPIGATGPSVPIAIAAPEAELVLGAELTLEPLRELFDQDPEHGVALIDGQGVALIGGDNPLIEEDVLVPLLGTRAEFSQEQRLGTVYGGLAPVAGTNWTVVVVTPASRVEASARAIQLRMYLTLGFSILGVVIVSLAVSRSVSQPIGALRDAALELAEGSYGKTLEVRRGDELGELARAFNHMSTGLYERQQRIDAQRQEIEGFNRVLQERVADRTRALEEAQQQLVRSGQLAAVAEVGAGLAHELNNPLSGILGIAQLLRARGPSAKEDALLSSIESEAERCRGVVSAITRFSSGELDPSDQPVVDLRGVMRDVVELVHGPCRQRGVDVFLEVPSEPLWVRLDSVHGTRIFAQILNTLRAGFSSGGRLDIALSAAAGLVEVTLRPSQPLRTNDDWMASGMGLWVARELLNQLDGQLVDPGDDYAWRVILPSTERGE